MSALLEILFYIFLVFVELVTHLLAFFFSSAYLAGQTKGIKRAFYVLAALSSLHLFFGLFWAVTIGNEEYLLSPVFGKAMMIISFVLLLFSILAQYAVEETSLGISENEVPDQGSSERRPAPTITSYLLALTIVFGIISIGTTAYKRKSLAEKLCSSVGDKVSDNWKSKGERLISIGEDKIGKKVYKWLPCIDDKANSR